MTHEEYKELLAADALTALDEGQAGELALHLQSCSECRAETVELENTASLLALVAEPVAPSSHVRENILAAIGREPQTSKILERQPDRGREQSRVIPFDLPKQNSWRAFRSFGAIAAMLAFVALLISLFVVWNQKRANENEVVRLSEHIRQTEAQLQHQQEVIALITTPGAHMTELSGTKAAPDAHAMIAYDKTGHAMLMAHGLPAPPSGKAYQLWFIMGTKPMPGKVFKTDPTGAGMLSDQVPAVALNTAVFAITLEPETGVQAPTGAVYLTSGS